MNRIAQTLFMLLYKRDKICDYQREMFCYHAEIILCSITLYSIVAIIALYFHRVLETITYTITVCFLRKLVGGFHTSRFIYCLFLSIGCVALSVFYFGPKLERIDPRMLMFFEFGGLSVWFFVPPRFVPQISLTEYELLQIRAAKKYVLPLLCLIQIAVACIFGSRLIVYSIIGQLTVLISWVIQDMNWRINKNEKTNKQSFKKCTKHF